MKRISFTGDWDKLRDPRFTTIRSYRPEKEAYYRGLVGQTLIVWRKTGRSAWNGHKLGTATLLSVEVVCPRWLPAGMIQQDVMTGGKPDPEWLARLMAMEQGLLLGFESRSRYLGWFDGR